MRELLRSSFRVHGVKEFPESVDVKKKQQSPLVRARQLSITADVTRSGLCPRTCTCGRWLTIAFTYEEGESVVKLL